MTKPADSLGKCHDMQGQNLGPHTSRKPVRTYNTQTGSQLTQTTRIIPFHPCERKKALNTPSLPVYNRQNPRKKNRPASENPSSIHKASATEDSRPPQVAE